MTTTNARRVPPLSDSSGRGRRRTNGIAIALVVLWVVLFLTMVATTEVGALVVRDTFVFSLFLLGQFLVIALGLPVGVVMSVVRRRWAPLFTSFVHLIVSIAVVLSVAWFPRRWWIDSVRGEPVTEANYTGTQNSATLTLRKSGRFDVFWYVWPGACEFFEGTYEINGAELRLRFKGDPPPVLPDRALIRSGNFSFERKGDGPPHLFVVARSQAR